MKICKIIVSCIKLFGIVFCFSNDFTFFYACCTLSLAHPAHPGLLQDTCMFPFCWVLSATLFYDVVADVDVAVCVKKLRLFFYLLVFFISPTLCVIHITPSQTFMSARLGGDLFLNLNLFVQNMVSLVIVLMIHVTLVPV